MSSESIFDALQVAMDAARAECASVHASRIDLTARADEATAALAVASAESESLRAQHAAAAGEINRLKSSFAGAITNNDKLQRRIQRRETSLAEAMERANAAECVRRRCEEEIKELREEASVREAVVDAVRASERQKDAELAAARAETKVLQGTLEAARADCDRRAAANEQLRLKVANRDARLAEIVSKAGDHEPFMDVSNFVAALSSSTVHCASTSATPQPSAPSVFVAPRQMGSVATEAQVGPACGCSRPGDTPSIVHFARLVLDATRTDASGSALEELTRRLFICMGYHGMQWDAHTHTTLQHSEPTYVHA